ncbi:MAG: hypothetical protein AAGA08_08485, partial [Pseudomonadota bacterium]
MSTLTGLAIARRGALDLLIMSEVVGQQLSHSVALSAERHSPYVATILRTTRTDEDLPELYDLLPSLYGILGKGIPVSAGLARNCLAQKGMGSRRSSRFVAPATPEMPSFAMTSTGMPLPRI